jgi:hypothetical protein
MLRKPIPRRAFRTPLFRLCDHSASFVRLPHPLPGKLPDQKTPEVYLRRYRDASSAPITAVGSSGRWIAFAFAMSPVPLVLRRIVDLPRPARLDETRKLKMMNDMNSMEGMGWMMWGTSTIWLLVLIVLVLVAAALIKYLRDGTRR